MKLWLLAPIESNSTAWKPWYDKSFGFVVVAETEERARIVASDKHGDEGIVPWLDTTQSSCTELIAGDKEKVILRDFAAA